MTGWPRGVRLAWRKAGANRGDARVPCGPLHAARREQHAAGDGSRATARGTRARHVRGAGRKDHVHRAAAAQHRCTRHNTSAMRSDAGARHS